MFVSVENLIIKKYLICFVVKYFHMKTSVLASEYFLIKIPENKLGVLILSKRFNSVTKPNRAERPGGH